MQTQMADRHFQRPAAEQSVNGQRKVQRHLYSQKPPDSATTKMVYSYPLLRFMPHNLISCLFSLHLLAHSHTHIRNSLSFISGELAEIKFVNMTIMSVITWNQQMKAKYINRSTRKKVMLGWKKYNTVIIMLSKKSAFLRLA